MDAMRWGGVQLKKVTPELQQKLGLPENEGLLVVAVDANSAGAAAGLKANDVLVKINTKAVPSDANGLSKLLTEQKANEPLELVVLRDGKEETLKGARMPTLLQVGPILGPGGVRPGIVLPPPIRIDLNRRLPMINPLQPGTITNLHIEMNVNGAKIIRDQKGDQFSGEYSKDDLKITVSGKIENGQGRATEITVTQGKETTKYANLKDVPAQHQRTLQQLMPSPLQNMMLFPMLPGLPDFPPGILPVFPEFER
jgi:membrane-associated protease RseP (regulator of RpoE activity)